MSDTRVAFLIWFVGVAVIVAFILIFIEIRLKRKRVEDAAEKREKTPLEKMNIFLNGDFETRKKLDIIGDTAKNYFSKKYELAMNLDYGELSRKFKKRDMELEFKFCDKMFEAYYSDHKLTRAKILSLGKDLEKIYDGEREKSNIPTVPGFEDKIKGLFVYVKNFFANKIREYVDNRNDKAERGVRIKNKQEHELGKWIRKSIRMGYDKLKVFDLLNDGKRSKHEIKKALNFYEKEFVQSVKKASGGDFYNVEGGIAKKIVQKEKDFLESAETYAK